MSAPGKPKARHSKPSPAEFVRIGIALNACSSGAHMVAATARALGLKPGSYVQIDCAERGTRIVRELRNCNCFSGTREGYVYVDGESAGYLCVEPRDKVQVTPSACNLDVP